MAANRPPLDCVKCPAFCCKMAGYVQVTETDIRRLAKFLGLTARGFADKHILEVTKKGEKLIKPGYEACQFLGPKRQCTVYEARPKDCRGYNCWQADDETVYENARFIQQPVAMQIELQNKKRAEAKR
jgi:Fe-S-cluster containining protein